MVANIRGYTPNYSFKLVNFDTPRWHTLEYANWTQLDSMLLQAGIAQIRGDWSYSTLYLVGDRVYDTDTGVLYRCLVEHVSAASGTFAADRAAHPTYWTLQTFGVPMFRGVWTATTVYAPGDIVVVGSYTYYLCIVSHTSPATFVPDATKWTLIFDATAAVNLTTTKATEASDSATQAATSATNASNSAAASQASAVESAAQAAKLFGTSTSSVLIGLGAKTFVTQTSKYFNVGKFLMIRATSNPVDMWMWGQVASYTGTSLVLNSQAFAGAGAFADWIIDVSGIKGADGTGGSGSASIATSDTPPPTPRDGDMWWQTNTGVLFVYYDDGDSQQWVQAVAVPSINNIVGVDADQSFTDAQKAQGRKNIYAAPFDAMAYNGMQVNGSMDVNQPVAGAVSTGYVIDNWNVGKFLAGGGVCTFNHIKALGWFSGLPSFLFTTVTTAQASISAADYFSLTQIIEGYRVARLSWGTANAQPITIGFWTSHHRTGLYSITIRHHTGAPSCALTYTQVAADVAQYNVVTFPGCPSGTWNNDNTAAILIDFAVAVGSDYTAPSTGNWISSGNYFAAPGQVNAIATTADVFRITGVVVLPSTQAPIAAQSALIMRPFDQELMMCQRYWRPIVVATGQAYSANVFRFSLAHLGMRAAPTVGTPSAAIVLTDEAATFPQSTAHMSVIEATANGGRYSCANFTGLVAFRQYAIIQVVGGYGILDARL